MLFAFSTAWRPLLVAAAVVAPALPATAVTPDAAPAGPQVAQRIVRVAPGAVVRRTVKLRTPASTVVVRGRAPRCGPVPTARLAIDGKTVVAGRIGRRHTTTLAARTDVGEGTHRLTLGLRGSAHPGPVCRHRRVRLTVRLLAGDPAQTVDGASGSPSPGAPSTSSTTAPSTTSPLPTGRPPAPVPVPPARPTLHWPAPSLSAPTTITVAQGDQWYTLSTTKDYILKLPATTHQGQVGFTGGRNVTMIGGAITIPSSSSKATGLAIKDATGTVHVEGLLVDGGGGHEMDGIQISAPQATVQLENVRVTGLRGSYSTNHSDVVQPFGGVAALRVDRLSGDSNYQGLYLRPDQGPIGAIDLRHVDLTYDDVGARTGGYLLWLSDVCDAAPTRLDEVYVQPKPGGGLAGAVWPPPSDANCPASILSGLATWADLPVTGHATEGTPPGGPFVPAGGAGPGYTSPGYG